MLTVRRTPCNDSSTSARRQHLERICGECAMFCTLICRIRNSESCNRDPLVCLTFSFYSFTSSIHFVSRHTRCYFTAQLTKQKRHVNVPVEVDSSYCCSLCRFLAILGALSYEVLCSCSPTRPLENLRESATSPPSKSFQGQLLSHSAPLHRTPICCETKHILSLL